MCPAHPDSSPSLSITAAHNKHGCVMICHRGCSYKDIITHIEAGTAVPRLARSVGNDGNDGPRVTYSYTDTAGQVVARKFRIGDGKGKRIWQEPRGFELPIYNAHLVVEAVAVGTEIFVAEGEKCCDVLVELGYVATCNPNGAGKWRPRDTAALVGASYVAVLADDDDPGRAHALRAVGALRAAGVVCEAFLCPDGHNDVADWALFGNLDLGRLLPMDGGGAVGAAAGAAAAVGAVSSWQPMPLPLDAVATAPDLCGLFYFGMSHELAGSSEAGKTMLLAGAAMEIARTGEPVVWVDMEMGPRLMSDRMRALGCTDEEIVRLVNVPETRRFHYLRPDERCSPADIAALLALKPALVAIDAMTTALGLHGMDSNSDMDVDALHRLISNPFKDSGAAVVWIDHPGKDVTRGSKGSIRKEQAVDIRYLVTPFTTYRKGSGGASRIWVKKDRTGNLDREVVRLFQLEADGLGWSWPTPVPRLEDRLDDPDQVREDALICLLQESGPQTRRQLRSQLLGRDEKKKELVDAMISAGKLSVIQGPSGWEQITLNPELA